MKLYFKYVSMLFKCQMQYRASFFMTLLGQFLLSFTGFLSVFFMFDRFQIIEGFTFSQVLLCFSIVLAAYSLAECFVRGFDVFQNLIQSGELDRILVRPRNEIFQVLVSNIDFSRLGKLAQAVLMLAYALATSGIHWAADKICAIILMLLGGIAMYTALFMLSAAICFFSIESLEVINIFTDGSRDFGKYPFSIYGEGILKFVTYIIPLACFQYYPFLYLIGKSNHPVYLLLPLACFVFLIPCYCLFRLGVKKYKSTGS